MEIIELNDTFKGKIEDIDYDTCHYLSNILNRHKDKKITIEIKVKIENDNE